MSSKDPASRMRRMASMDFLSLKGITCRDCDSISFPAELHLH